MKITGVRVAAVAQPDTGAQWALTEIDTDAGVRGLGLAAAAVADPARRLAEDLLVGEDPRAVVMLWRQLTERIVRDGGATPPAAAALLDLALWDIRAHLHDEPLWRLLGSGRPRARVHLNFGAEDPGEVAVADGIGAALLEASAALDQDGHRLEVARSVLEKRTRDPELLLDLGGRFDPESAVHHVGELERQFDIACVQAGGPGWDEDDFRFLSEHVIAAVCNAEDAGGMGFSPPLDAFALDVVRIDPARRGITGALQMADAAYGYELPVMLCGQPGDVGAHLAGAMPSFMGLELGDAGKLPAGFGSEVRIEGGWAVAGDAPGLGVRVGREFLEALLEAGA